MVPAAARATPAVGGADGVDGWPPLQHLMGRRLQRVAQRERRVALWFRLYQAGLYLPEDAAGRLDGQMPEAPRRLWVRLHTDVGAARLQALWRSALQPTLRQLGEQSPEAQQLRTLAHEAMGRHQGLHAGDVLTIDWLPGDGLLMRVNDSLSGRATVSAEVFHALTSLWLDERAAPGGQPVWLVSR